MSHRNTSFPVAPNHHVIMSESDSSDSTFRWFSTSSSDDDSDDSDWDEAPATQPPAPRIPDLVINGHRQEGESDLRRGNRCAILAICRHFFILGPSSTSRMPRDAGPLGEHTEPRGAEENNEITGARVI